MGKKSTRKHCEWSVNLNLPATFPPRGFSAFIISCILDWLVDLVVRVKKARKELHSTIYSIRFSPDHKFITEFESLIYGQVSRYMSILRMLCRLRQTQRGINSLFLWSRWTCLRVRGESNYDVSSSLDVYHHNGMHCSTSRAAASNKL